MSTDKSAEEALVRSLCEEARTLAAGVRGPLSRIAITAGEHQVEVAWHEAAAPGVAVEGRPDHGASAAVEDLAADTAGRHAVVAPLVGTFYRSPEPNAKPFVEEGDAVEAGANVAIIEAMKIMNHIQAEQSGTISKILVEDGDMVEFGQELMLIEPTGEPT